MRSVRGARLCRAWAAACVAGALVACAGTTQQAGGPKVPSTAAELGVAAYVYAYPLMLFDRERQAQANALGAHNRLVARTATATPFSSPGVAPDADTVSAVAFLDLRTGPLVLSVPASGDRFTRIELLDAYTNVFASLGQRTQGNEARNFLITGPNQRATAGGNLVEVRSPTQFALLHGQVAANGERDVPAASGVMKQWSLTPLSAFQKGQRVKAVERPRGGSSAKNVVAEVEALQPTKYFEEAAKLMQLNPPAEADAPLIKKFLTLGLDARAGRFTPGKLKSDVAQKAWNQGRLDIKNAQPALREQAGWTFSPASGSWGVDYLSRAAAARVGIGGKLAADGIDATARVDASGQKLQGAHSYVIEFAPPPPVHAFWSLTLLDAEGRMVDNVLNRYSLRGDRLRKRDGALRVYVSLRPPEEDRRTNWLPAPAGPFQLVLRLYEPKQPAIDGTWQPPAIQRTD